MENKGREQLGLGESGARIVTLVEEVDGFHTGVLLVADLQLVELAKQIYQPLHHLHAILTEAEESDTDSQLCSKNVAVNNIYNNNILNNVSRGLRFVPCEAISSKQKKRR